MGFLLLGVLVAELLALFGLFNRGRSLPCALAGLVVLLGSALGAWVSFTEGPSPEWLAIYTGNAGIGLVALLRQLRASGGPADPESDGELR
jgi:peptidoglycan/LPS O-acetylase OafA/YrhL